MEKEKNNTEVLTYSAIGILTLGKLSGFTLAPISPFLPMISVGGIGCSALFGIYRILTRDNREHKKIIKNKKNEFERIFIGAGIKNKEGNIPILSEIWESEYETIYSFVKPDGFSTHLLDSNDIVIKEYFETDNVEFESKGEFINIRVASAELPRFIPFKLPKVKNPNEVIVSLGRDIKGNDVELNLSRCPNVLCSGMTGSGKSVNMNVVAVQLYINYPNVEIYLIDMKCVELGVYADLPQTKKYTNKLEGAREIIKELLKECDRRNDLLNKKKVKKLSDYNKKVKSSEKLNPIVLIIDEAVRLMGDKDLNKDIAELGFICRSVEISIILNIQRPTAKLMNPDTKASLTNIIGFKTINRKNSEIICDSTVLSTLRGKGHGMLFNEDNDGVEFQGYYLDENNIEKYLNNK